MSKRPLGRYRVFARGAGADRAVQRAEEGHPHGVATLHATSAADRWRAVYAVERRPRGLEMIHHSSIASSRWGDHACASLTLRAGVRDVPSPPTGTGSRAVSRSQGAKQVTTRPWSNSWSGNLRGPSIFNASTIFPFAPSGGRTRPSDCMGPLGAGSGPFIAHRLGRGGGQSGLQLPRSTRPPLPRTLQTQTPFAAPAPGQRRRSATVAVVLLPRCGGSKPAPPGPAPFTEAGVALRTEVVGMSRGLLPRNPLLLNLRIHHLTAPKPSVDTRRGRREVDLLPGGGATIDVAHA